MPEDAVSVTFTYDSDGMIPTFEYDSEAIGCALATTAYVATEATTAC